MDRETEGIQAALELIESIFELPEPRRKKCETLFRLARRSKGRIVELGSYHGNGSVALSLGKGNGNGNVRHVYTVDDYTPKRGWAGETYGSEDEIIFRENLKKSGVFVTQIKQDVIEAGKEFPVKIYLLFWDLGQDRVEVTMEHWEPHIKSGGILAIHDTYSNLFGAADYIKELVAAGKYCQYEVMPGGVHVAVKR